MIDTDDFTKNKYKYRYYISQSYITYDAWNKKLNVEGLTI